VDFPESLRSFCRLLLAHKKHTINPILLLRWRIKSSVSIYLFIHQSFYCLNSKYIYLHNCILRAFQCSTKVGDRRQKGDFRSADGNRKVIANRFIDPGVLFCSDCGVRVFSLQMVDSRLRLLQDNGYYLGLCFPSGYGVCRRCTCYPRICVWPKSSETQALHEPLLVTVTASFFRKKQCRRIVR